MKSEYIPKVITLLAGAVVCVVSIMKHMDTTYSLELLLATLIIFYIIGLIAQQIIKKVENSNHFIRHKRDEELDREVSLEMEEDTEEGMIRQEPESE